MSPRWIRSLFAIAAAYDLVLGVGVLICYKPLYAWAGIALPNHEAYIHFGAAVVAVMGFGFALVAARPAGNRGLIHVGVLFKLAYAGTVLGHYFLGSIPVMWTVFAWCDLVFATGFVWALRALPKSAGPGLA